MEFKEAMRIWKRMCKTHKECKLCGLCDDCLGAGGFAEDCDEHNVEAILAKWAAEHPEKTRIDDFLDKHPRATLDDNDTPRACAKHLGYCTECIDEGDMDRCDECWRRPMEEVEG